MILTATLLLQLAHIAFLPPLDSATTAPAPDSSLAAQVIDTVIRAPMLRNLTFGWISSGDTSVAGSLVVGDTARPRKRKAAVEYSDFYGVRLTLHRWLSFAMIPLFVGSYISGDQILKYSSAAPDWAKKTHRPLATATAVVFTTNTVTGLWNLWEGRKDEAGRTKRWIHSLLFIAADAGFTYAGTKLGKLGENDQEKRRQHRLVALSSMGISFVSWSMMLLFK